MGGRGTTFAVLCLLAVAACGGSTKRGPGLLDLSYPPGSPQAAYQDFVRSIARGRNEAMWAALTTEKQAFLRSEFRKFPRNRGLTEDELAMVSKSYLWAILYERRDELKAARIGTVSYDRRGDARLELLSKRRSAVIRMRMQEGLWKVDGRRLRGSTFVNPATMSARSRS